MKNWLFEKHGKIYFKLKDGSVVLVDNIYGNDIPDIISVGKYKGNYYIKGAEPKELKNKGDI